MANYNCKKIRVSTRNPGLNPTWRLVGKRKEGINLFQQPKRPRFQNYDKQKMKNIIHNKNKEKIIREK